MGRRSPLFGAEEVGGGSPVCRGISQSCPDC